METANTVSVILKTIGVYILITTIFYCYKLFSANVAIRKFYKRKVIRNIVLVLVLFVLFILFNMLGMNNARVGVDSVAGGPQFGYVNSPMSGLFAPRGIDMNPVGVTCPPGYHFNTSSQSCTTGSTNNSITDTREFLKKSFSATLKTRYVEDVAMMTEKLIEDSGGRLDSSNVGTEAAYFSFVIPKSSFASFKSELRTYTNKKLYTQSESTQNMLNDKQNLESQQETNKANTEQLAAQKQKVQADYTKTSKDLTSQISALQSKINSLNMALANTTDEQTRVGLRQQISDATVQMQVLQQRLSQATTNFKSNMSNLGVSLDEQSKILMSLNNQEDAFFDNLDTVQGTISIYHVSFWQLLTALSPINPIIIIGVLLVIIRVLSLRKRERMIIAETTTSTVI